VLVPWLAKAAGEHKAGSKPPQALADAMETQGFYRRKGLIDLIHKDMLI
jgi:hypothetical protein